MAFIVVFGGLIAATYVFLRLLLTYTQGDREPVAVATGIPFISSLLGLARQSRFYIEMRDKHNLPIYTLRLPGSRIYVVNDTKLIAAAQHQIRILDFAPIETRAAINVMGASPAGQDILNMDRSGIGKHSYAIEFDKAIHPAVSPGAQLDAMNKAAVDLVSASLDALAAELPRTIKLFEWVKREIALATSEAVYGPENPFSSATILDAFWTFEPGIVVLLLNFLPSILAKDSIEAREVIVKAFSHYFESAGHEKGSALIRARYQHSANYNVSIEDTARFELGGAVAILTNTIPTAFWVLWHIISDATALRECRDELDLICQKGDQGFHIDITEIKSSCPVLVSTLQEVLRFHGTGTSVRVVQQDHVLNGEYLLKKDSTLMIPGPVLHSSEVIYGADVRKFQHRRFLRTTPDTRLNPAGFRGFGGGSTLCPGRHFVSTEIIAFVALAILRFDFRPVRGSWVRPTTIKAGAQATVPAPDFDVDVEVEAREHVDPSQLWNITMRGSDKALKLVIEDYH